MNGDEVDFIDVFILSPSQIVTLSKRFTVRSDSFMEQQNLIFIDGITVTVIFITSAASSPSS